MGHSARVERFLQPVCKYQQTIRNVVDFGVSGANGLVRSVGCQNFLGVVARLLDRSHLRPSRQTIASSDLLVAFREEATKRIDLAQGEANLFSFRIDARCTRRNPLRKHNRNQILSVRTDLYLPPRPLQTFDLQSAKTRVDGNRSRADFQPRFAPPSEHSFSLEVGLRVFEPNERAEPCSELCC